MVGLDNQLISALFAMRLVTVHFLYSLQLFQADLITSDRILKVNSRIGETLISFDLLRQSWRVFYSFGTTSLPSEWRSISFGNQNGIS